MKLGIFLLLFFPLLGQAAEEIHSRQDLDLLIPDQGSARYVIEHLGPLVADRVELKVTLDHSKPSDLMVMFLSPLGKYAVLPLTPFSEGNHFNIDVTSDDMLSDFIGENSFGRWEVLVYDQAPGGSGVIHSVELRVIGNQPVAPVPTKPIVVKGNGCSEKWNSILAEIEYGDDYQPMINKCGTELLQLLFKAVDNQRSVTYEQARKLIFTSLDNRDGIVCSVYSNRCIETDDIPSNSTMNCEHTWPQSLGAVGPAKSDLHHLFPAISKENSDRSTFPFCEVVEPHDKTVGILGTSRTGYKCFEPPIKQKGDTARAMFYFSLRYKMDIDYDQEAVLRKWNHLDPVSEKESLRNVMIKSIQGKSNPFVDHPEFVDLIIDF